MSSAICFNLNQSKILPSGNGLKSITRNLENLASSRTGSFGCFIGVPVGKTYQNPSLVLVKPRKCMNMWAVPVMTEIMLQAAISTVQLINLHVVCNVI